jgi:hypothetical protein
MRGEETGDRAAVREVDARLAAGAEEWISTAVVKRLTAGEHPVRVWREHRDMTGRYLRPRTRRAGGA